MMRTMTSRPIRSRASGVGGSFHRRRDVIQVYVPCATRIEASNSLSLRQRHGATAAAIHVDVHEVALRRRGLAVVAEQADLVPDAGVAEVADAQPGVHHGWERDLA